MPRAHYTAESFEATESIGFLVRRCATLMTATGELKLAQIQPALSLTQWIVLMRLRSAAHLSASTLAGDIGHDLGSLTRVIDGLADQGLVRRARSRVDRRGVELRLTAAGRRLTDAHLPMMVENLNDLLSGFTAGEARQLHVLMKALMQALQKRLERLSAASAELSTAEPKARRTDKTSRSSAT